MSAIALPADLEARLAAGPPRHLALLLLLLLALPLGFLAWLAWAEVERVVRAEGRIQPAGRIKVINHPRGGRVVEIFVREGQRVQAGAPLFALDTREAKARYEELETRLFALDAEIARLQAELEGRPYRPEPLPEGIERRLVEAQRRLLGSRLAAFEENRRALMDAVESREGELARALAEVDRLRLRLELERQQIEAVRRLTDQGLYPRLKLLAMEQELADTEAELRKAEAAAREARAARDESMARLDALARERESRLEEALAELTEERELLLQERELWAEILDSNIVRAPVAGIVQNLALQAPGQALAANAPAMELVPSDDELLVEAFVANEDVDEVRPGMRARIKVRAFDALRGETLSGTVREVAADAVALSPDQPPVYRVILAIDPADDPARKALLRSLQSGMVVEVAFIAGTRTLLAYFLEQILAVRDAAFTEG